MTVYTHGHHESVLRSPRWRPAENSAGYLLPVLRPGLSVLDVGAGPGTITADLAALVAPGRGTPLETGPAPRARPPAAGADPRRGRAARARHRRLRDRRRARAGLPGRVLRRRARAPGAPAC